LPKLNCYARGRIIILLLGERIGIDSNIRARIGRGIWEYFTLSGKPHWMGTHWLVGLEGVRRS
jgi:hypothetical protein